MQSEGRAAERETPTLSPVVSHAAAGAFVTHSMSRTPHLVRSSFLLFFIFGLDKITGFAKLLLTTRLFGAGPEMDAFATANQLPELLLALLAAGALSAAFIPVYSGYLTRCRRRQAASLAGTVVTLTMTIMGAACLLAIVAAPWLIRVALAPHFPAETQQLTAQMMRIFLLAALLISVSGVFGSLLHAHQHFLTPALGRVLIDLGQIVGLIALAPVWGVYGMAWGSVLGALLTVLAQLPALARHRVRLRLRIDLRLQGVREVVRLMGPRVMTLGAFQAVDLIFIRLASPLPAGSIAAFYYAMLVMLSMPKSLFGAAVSQVIFPTMAEQYNAGAGRQLRHTVTQGVRATWLLLIPAAVGLLALGRPAVSFLFERGAFGPESSALVYLLMAIFSVRLLGEASYDVLALTFFARHNTHAPMWATLGWMLVNVGLSLLLVGPFGIAGLAWAASIAALALATALFALNLRVDGVDVPMLGAALGRALVSSLVMYGVVLLLHPLRLPPALFILAGATGGGFAFFCIYLLLGGAEVLTALRLMRRGLLRAVMSTPIEKILRIR